MDAKVFSKGILFFQLVGLLLNIQNSAIRDTRYVRRDDKFDRNCSQEKGDRNADPVSAVVFRVKREGSQAGAHDHKQRECRPENVKPRNSSPPTFQKNELQATIILRLAEPGEKRCYRNRNTSFSAEIC